jgi:hypothetical protein
VLADAVVGIDHPPPVHVAVDGTAGGARGLADDLSRVLEARGRRCRRVSLDATGFLHRQGPGQGPIAHRGRPGDDLVVVDGRFLQHPEFQGAWELVVFLREDAGGDRDGDVSRYVAQVDPEIAADVVVDLHDPAWPVVRRVGPAVAGRLRPEVLLDETRAFFAPRAAAWENHFPDDDAAYGAAVAELGLRAGQTALDAGCGTGRALPHLRAAVGPDGTVLGVDLTPEMLATARRHGRHRHALLAMADARRLPLRAGAVDGASPPGCCRTSLIPAVPWPTWPGSSAPAASWPCSTRAAGPPWRPGRAASRATTTCSPLARSTGCSGPAAGRWPATTTGRAASSPWPSGEAGDLAGRSGRAHARERRWKRTPSRPNGWC